MRILVTGGAGYVGSAIVRHLARAGHKVVAYDDLSAGNPQSVVEPAELVVGDITHNGDLMGTLRGFATEAVIHCAALASVPESLEDPADYYRVNVLGTRNVLEAMLAEGVRKVIFTSTAAVYSHDQAMPLHEASKTVPATPYGDTKLAAERMIHWYAMAYEMAYTTLRLFNVGGAEPHHGEAREHEEHLIPRLLSVVVGKSTHAVINGADFITSPDGTCVRDYVHVLDVAEITRLAAERLKIGKSGVYNVCAARASVFNVLDLAERVTGQRIPREIAPRRAGDPGTLTGSIHGLWDRFEFAPTRSIADIVESAWDWFRQHPDGYAG